MNIYLDSSKSFDTLDHNTLEHYGVSPLLFLEYIGDFLTANKLFKFLIYADYTLCYSQNNSPRNDTINKYTK